MFSDRRLQPAGPVRLAAGKLCLSEHARGSGERAAVYPDRCAPDTTAEARTDDAECPDAAGTAEQGFGADLDGAERGIHVYRKHGQRVRGRDAPDFHHGQPDGRGPDHGHPGGANVGADAGSTQAGHRQDWTGAAVPTAEPGPATGAAAAHYDAAGSYHDVPGSASPGHLSKRPDHPPGANVRWRAAPDHVPVASPRTDGSGGADATATTRHGLEHAAPHAASVPDEACVHGPLGSAARQDPDLQVPRAHLAHDVYGEFMEAVLFFGELQLQSQRKEQGVAQGHGPSWQAARL